MCLNATLLLLFIGSFRPQRALISGTGKTRNDEMEIGTGDEKMGIFLHNCITCPLCIQQHLLEQTSATGDSGEEVEHMHQLN